MLKTVKEYLKKNEWHFSQVKDKDVFLFGIAGVNGSFQCIADINEEEHKFLFFSVCGANSPLEKRETILGLLNRINYNLLIGNFEMDFEDGEIRYRTCISYEFITPSIDIVDELIMTNIITMDRCLPGIIGVIGGLSQAQAIELIDTSEEANSEK